MAREIIDLYAVMQHIPEIMNMNLVWRKGAWEGRYYISGEPHSYKRDKLKVKFWRNDKGCSIWIYEQGGESMSLQQWLVRYGGASDNKDAVSIMRGKSIPDFRLQTLIRNRGIETEVRYVPMSDYTACSRFDLERCPLFVWLCGIYGRESVEDVFRRYHVTTDGNGYAVFWYTNSDGKICYDKRIKYKYDGHRDKTFGGTRKYLTKDGYMERPMFGAHLVYSGNEDSDKEVCVVESEKSALILSLTFPDKTFLATGGKNNLRDVDDCMLLYPDMDAIELWSSIPHARIVEWWNGEDVLSDHDDYADVVIRKKLCE